MQYLDTSLQQSSYTLNQLSAKRTIKNGSSSKGPVFKTTFRKSSDTPISATTIIIARLRHWRMSNIVASDNAVLLLLCSKQIQ